jgi:hypothetical protein
MAFAAGVPAGWRTGRRPRQRLAELYGARLRRPAVRALLLGRWVTAWIARIGAPPARVLEGIAGAWNVDAVRLTR